MILVVKVHLQIFLLMLLGDDHVLGLPQVCLAVDNTINAISCGTLEELPGIIPRAAAADLPLGFLVP